MDTVLQFRSSMMGLAFCLLNYRADSHSVVTPCAPGSQPWARVQCYSRAGITPSQGEGLWDGCGKGGLGAEDPVRHCFHNPVSPSCLRVPGLTLETQFGLPVCPAGGSQAYILSHHPTPTSPGPQAPASWRVMAVCMSTWRARWLPRCCWCQNLGPGRHGKR